LSKAKVTRKFEFRKHMRLSTRRQTHTDMKTLMSTIRTIGIPSKKVCW